MARAGKNARNFNIDLRKFGVQTQAQVGLAVRKIALDITADVVMMTPVDTGRARANWLPSLQVPNTAITDQTDKSGGKAMSEMAAVASSFQIGDTIWLSNNLPYILKLENGHSKQAPQGMVEVTMSRYAGAT